MKPSLFPALFVLLSLVGCASPIATAKRVLAPIATAFNTLEPQLEAREAAELEACLAPPIAPADGPACVETAAKRWAKTSAAATAAHEAIVLAKAALDLAEAYAAADQALGAGELAQLLALALDAADKVRAIATSGAAP